MKTFKHLLTTILIIFLVPLLSTASATAATSEISTAAGGDKSNTINKNSAAISLKDAIDRAAAETNADSAVKIIRTACAQQESIETELIIFEFLFLTQKHGRYNDNFNEFVKLAGAHKDKYLKNHYQRIAELYSTFVNYALNRDELIIKSESAIKRTPAAKDKNDILHLLHNKYSAAFEAAKKDAAMRKTSPDFISYLEKKCAGKAPEGSEPAAETSDGGDLIVNAFKEMAADRRASKLIERRSLLLLMIYKNIRESADDFHKQLIISLIRKNIAETLINKVVPEIFKK
jgi:hypothetical protein